MAGSARISPLNGSSSSTLKQISQFLLDMQGDLPISQALAQTTVQSLTTQASQLKQQVLYRDMALACKARMWGSQQSLLWSLVLVLMQQVAAAQQQLDSSQGAQERLQQHTLELQRALAAAQQRKHGAEARVRTLQQETKAAAVALKTVASMLVNKSEQKAELQCSAQLVQHTPQGGQQEHAAAEVVLLTRGQQPVTPPAASSSLAGAVQDKAVHADHMPIPDCTSAATQDCAHKVASPSDTVSTGSLEVDDSYQETPGAAAPDMLSPSCSSSASTWAPVSASTAASRHHRKPLSCSSSPGSADGHRASRGHSAGGTSSSRRGPSTPRVVTSGGPSSSREWPRWR